MTALPEKTGTLTSADGVKIFYRHGNRTCAGFKLEGSDIAAGGW
jgi:hypothetical protein